MDAVILAGGVVKGAFAAGALSVLSTLDLRVRRIVATSAGALNGSFYASAIRSGTERFAGKELPRIWLEEATLRGGFELSPSGILRLEGLSTSKKLREVLRRHIRPSTAQRPIDLRLVTTNTAGDVGRLGPEHLGRTFEHVLHYDGRAFDDAAGLERVFEGVTASAAFPGVFRPVSLKVDGRIAPCVDGGVVNNTPVKHAIDRAPEIDRVFVIVPFPAYVPDDGSELRALSGLPLAVRLAEIAIEERLYRDLRDAYAVNATLARLEALIPDDAERAGVLGAFGWTGRRRLDIVEIRPAVPLEGGAFDGLIKPSLREAYVGAGERAARAWVTQDTAAKAAARKNDLRSILRPRV